MPILVRILCVVTVSIFFPAVADWSDHFHPFRRAFDDRCHGKAWCKQKKLKKATHQFRDKLFEADAAKKAMAAELKSQREKLATCASASERLRVELARSQSAEEDLRTRLRNMSERCAPRQPANDSEAAGPKMRWLASQLQIRKAQIEKLKAEINELKSSPKQMQSEAQNEKMKAEIDELKSSPKQMQFEAQNENLKAEIDALKSSMHQMQLEAEIEKLANLTAAKISDLFVDARSESACVRNVDIGAEKDHALGLEQTSEALCSWMWALILIPLSLLCFVYDAQVQAKMRSEQSARLEHEFPHEENIFELSYSTLDKRVGQNAMKLIRICCPGVPRTDVTVGLIFNGCDVSISGRAFGEERATWTKKFQFERADGCYEFEGDLAKLEDGVLQLGFRYIPFQDRVFHFPDHALNLDDANDDVDHADSLSPVTEQGPIDGNKDTALSSSHAGPLPSSAFGVCRGDDEASESTSSDDSMDEFEKVELPDASSFT